MRSLLLAATTDRQWLTPDDESTGPVERPVFVPEGEYYEAAFRGALLLLADVASWEKFGTVDPEVAAGYFWEAFLLTEAAW